MKKRAFRTTLRLNQSEQNRLDSYLELSGIHKSEVFRKALSAYLDGFRLEVIRQDKRLIDSK